MLSGIVPTPTLATSGAMRNGTMATTYLRIQAQTLPSSSMKHALVTALHTPEQERAYTLAQNPYISESPQYGAQTNQRAELYAVVLALKNVMLLVENKTQNVVLISDSMYVVKGMMDWVYKWRENKWRNSKGLEVANRDEFEWLDDLVEDLEEYCGVQVKFWHVPKALNQGADELARRALGY